MSWLPSPARCAHCRQSDRETLMAAAYYGFSAREISEAWNVPIGTIKTRLRLAVHKLRDELAGVTL